MRNGLPARVIFFVMSVRRGYSFLQSDYDGNDWMK
jgi:hypothetical protein